MQQPAELAPHLVRLPLLLLEHARAPRHVDELERGGALLAFLQGGRVCGALAQPHEGAKLTRGDQPRVVLIERQPD
eukprot:scaffold49288_cov63-Phaeocystis_antarctica.AAC.7